MDNNTTIPSMLGAVNTMPSSLGPVSSRYVRPKPRNRVTLSRIAFWLVLGVAVVLAVRYFTR